MNDINLADAVRNRLAEECDSLSTVHLAIPASEIMASADKTRRRRRLGVLGGAGGLAAAAALGLTSVLAGGPAPALATGAIRTTAFTLVKSTDGTVKLTLTQSQMFNPGVLQQALAKDGIPALVKIGVFCSSHPALDPHGEVSIQLSDGTPVAGPGPSGSQRVPIPPDSVTVINPAAIPAGTELFFDYVNVNHEQGLWTGLIRTDSYTCVNGDLPPGGP